MLNRYDANADAIDHVVLECGAAGYSRAQMAACVGVPKYMLKNWAEDNARFAIVLARAETLAQAHWESLAQSGEANGRVGQSVWHKTMSARFPDEYADRVEQGDIGESGAIQEIVWKVKDVER